MFTQDNIYFMSPMLGKFKINRKISIIDVNGVTDSQDAANPEIVLHIKNSYDERLNCGKSRKHIVAVLRLVLAVAEVNGFHHYQVPLKKLKPYVTLKSDVKKDRVRRPNEDYSVSWSVNDNIQEIGKTIFDPSAASTSSLCA
jgi:hypothetical protein